MTASGEPHVPLLRQSYPEETLLELVHLGKVCFHMWIPGLVCFVGEVDDELRIPFDDDVLDSERNGGLEAADEPLILRDVVGDLAARALLLIVFVVWNSSSIAHSATRPVALRLCIIFSRG